MGRATKNKKGEYFRNNVWWWRPLWAFVCDLCGDILNDKDKENGSYNNGHPIEKEKALAIAVRLKEKLADGTVEKMVRAHQKEVKRAEKENKGKKVGDAGYQWTAAYPATVKNVRDFAAFCENSEGFEIW